MMKRSMYYLVAVVSVLLLTAEDALARGGRGGGMARGGGGRPSFGGGPSMEFVEVGAHGEYLVDVVAGVASGDKLISLRMAEEVSR